MSKTKTCQSICYNENIQIYEICRLRGCRLEVFDAYNKSCNIKSVLKIHDKYLQLHDKLMFCYVYHSVLICKKYSLSMQITVIKGKLSLLEEMA